jgi:hypothetical protein
MELKTVRDSLVRGIRAEPAYAGRQAPCWHYGVELRNESKITVFKAYKEYLRHAKDTRRSSFSALWSIGCDS